ncbi:MAG TPA: hypothetical protein VME66_12155 [Candidatus Acidoferrales bacterium]|nr:hypothetical protein [Candidatus Acidoferrales bacterium]
MSDPPAYGSEVLRSPFKPTVRPRILERFVRAGEYPVTIVVAPAGLGKSVAVRQFLAETRRRSLRFTVQREHASLLAFVRGFMGVASPENVGNTAEAYRNARRSTDPARECALWVAQFLDKTGVTIFVDDLQKAQKEPAADREISKFLQHLVETTNAQIKWIIATRDPLDLPLASWLASGTSDLPIDEIDLVLTESEAHAIALSIDTPLDAIETNSIFELVKGLPFAFSMALSSWRSGESIFSSAHAAKARINQFFNEHVFSELEPNVRSFLLKTALFRELDVNLLMMAGLPHARANVSKLRLASFCLSEESEGVFRHHDLFQEFLEERLRAQGHAALQEAYESARAACEMSKAFDRAIDLASEFGDAPALVRLLGEHATTLFEYGQATVLERALSRFERETFRNDAAALYAQGLVDTLHGHSEDAAASLHEALEMAQDQPKLFMQIGYRLAALYSDGDQWEAARQLVERLSKMNSGDPEFDLVMYGRACVNSLRSGRNEVNIADIERLRDGLAQALGKRAQINLLFSLAALMLYHGTFEQSRAYAMEGLRKALEESLYYSADRLVRLLFIADYELGEFEGALLWASRHEEYSQKLGDTVSRTASLQQKYVLYAQKVTLPHESTTNIGGESPSQTARQESHLEEIAFHRAADRRDPQRG